MRLDTVSEMCLGCVGWGWVRGGGGGGGGGRLDGGGGGAKVYWEVMYNDFVSYCWRSKRDRVEILVKYECVV